MIKLKNDEYRRVRGGKAFMIHIYCSRCNNKILYYQKDGDGPLKRCYLNRIFWPKEFEKLQYNKTLSHPNTIPALICPQCQTVIGKAILHHDGRMAFRLRPGFCFKKRDTDVTRKENK